LSDRNRSTSRCCSGGSAARIEPEREAASFLASASASWRVLGNTSFAERTLAISPAALPLAAASRAARATASACSAESVSTTVGVR
jgi:hypothetical protein